MGIACEPADLCRVGEIIQVHVRRKRMDGVRALLDLSGVRRRAQSRCSGPPAISYGAECLPAFVRGVERDIAFELSVRSCATVDTQGRALDCGTGNELTSL